MYARVVPRLTSAVHPHNVHRSATRLVLPWFSNVHPSPRRFSRTAHVKEGDNVKPRATFTEMAPDPDQYAREEETADEEIPSPSAPPQGAEFDSRPVEGFLVQHEEPRDSFLDAPNSALPSQDPNEGGHSGGKEGSQIEPSASVALEPIPDPPVEGHKYKIGEREFDQYLTPLYKRQWAIVIARTHYRGTRQDILAKSKYPRLVRSFDFTDLDATLAFAQDLADISRSEGYYPSVSYTKDWLRVEIWTETHDVLGSPTTENSPPEVTGVTLRDIRMAILIECLFADQYLPTNRGQQRQDYKRMGFSHVRPSTSSELDLLLSGVVVTDKPITVTFNPVKTPSVKQLEPQGRHTPAERRESTSQAKLPIKCPCCGGKHTILDCSMRSTIPPPCLCTYCGGQHWSIDCPDPPAHRMKVKGCPCCGGAHEIQRCEERQARPPKHGCRLCQGAHWTPDCPMQRCPCCGGGHTLDRCKSRKTAKPKVPCSNCGEDHWSLDCPLLRSQSKIRLWKLQNAKLCPICSGRHREDECRKAKRRQEGGKQPLPPLLPVP